MVGTIHFETSGLAISAHCDVLHAHELHPLPWTQGDTQASTQENMILNLTHPRKIRPSLLDYPANNETYEAMTKYNKHAHTKAILACLLHKNCFSSLQTSQDATVATSLQDIAKLTKSSANGVAALVFLTTKQLHTSQNLQLLLEETTISEKQQYINSHYKLCLYNRKEVIHKWYCVTWKHKCIISMTNLCKVSAKLVQGYAKPLQFLYNICKTSLNSMRRCSWQWWCLQNKCAVYVFTISTKSYTAVHYTNVWNGSGCVFQ